MTDANQLREKIRDAVRESVHRIAGIPPTDIVDASRYNEDLGLDSLSALEVVVDIEYAFKVKLAEGRIPSIKTVQDTLDVVQEYLAAVQPQV